MKNFFEDMAAMLAMLCMVVGLWLGFTICALAYNPNAADMQIVEQQLNQAREQYIAWFNEDPTKE